tara:strand:+ start:949 stop:3162 length:2214 start_codon:yes stop_codon:yes gene_type:complete
MNHARIELLRAQKRITPKTAAAFSDLVTRGVEDPCLEEGASPGVIQEWLLFCRQKCDAMEGIRDVKRILLSIKDHHSHRIMDFVRALHGKENKCCAPLDTYLSGWLSMTQRRDVLECVLWKWLDTASLLGEEQHAKDTRVTPCTAIEAAKDPCRFIRVLSAFASHFHTRLDVCETVDDVAIRNGWWRVGDIKRSCAVTFDAVLRCLQMNEYTTPAAIRSHIQLHSVEVERALEQLVAQGAVDTLPFEERGESFYTLPHIKEDASEVRRLITLLADGKRCTAWADLSRFSADADDRTGTTSAAEEGEGVEVTSAQRTDIACLNAAQFLLVRRVCEGHRFTTCCSPPGTGKTFSSRVMASFATSVLGLSFTHQALAKLKSDVQRSTARATFMTVQKFVLLHNAQKTSTARSPLVELVGTVDLVVVDECSMGTMSQTRALLEAFADSNARLVFLGDFNQLPPIGRGAPFRDIVTTMGCNAELKTSMRSDVEGILNACASILEGTVPIADAPGMTLHPDSVDPTRALMACLPAFESVDSTRSTQSLTTAAVNARTKAARIITHTRANVRRVNEMMQARAHVTQGRGFNGNEKQICYVGDIVRCTANTDSYTNGMTGVLVEIVQRERTVQVSASFTVQKKRCRKWAPVAVVQLSGEEDDAPRFVDVDEYHIEPSYAVTAHKSQGSEYDDVFLLIFKSDVHAVRELYYTAASRARKQLRIVGHVEGLRESKRDGRVTVLGLGV